MGEKIGRGGAAGVADGCAGNGEHGERDGGGVDLEGVGDCGGVGGHGRWEDVEGEGVDVEEVEWGRGFGDFYDGLHGTLWVRAVDQESSGAVEGREKVLSLYRWVRKVKEKDVFWGNRWILLKIFFVGGAGGAVFAGWGRGFLSVSFFAERNRGLGYHTRCRRGGGWLA